MKRLPVLLLSLLAPTVALAQNVQVAPVSEKELRNYCVWNNRIYSHGARFCVTPKLLIVCQKSKDDVLRGFLVWSSDVEENCTGTISPDGVFLDQKLPAGAATTP